MKRSAFGPRLVATLAAAAALLMLAGAALSRLTDSPQHWTDEDRRNAVARGDWQVTPLQLITADGTSMKAFDAAAAPDDVWLVEFTCARCETVCKALGSEYFRMQQQLAADAPGSGRTARAGARVRLLSVSLDPAHDGPTELTGLARLHRADARWWTLGAPAAAKQGLELQRRLGVVATPDGFGGFAHNAGIHLVDGRGRVRGVYDYAQWETALAEARRLSGDRS